VQAVSREQILEQARAESASTIDDEQEPFRDSVESGTIGEATAELQFGTGDSNTSNELVKQGNAHLEATLPMVHKKENGYLNGKTVSKLL